MGLCSLLIVWPEDLSNVNTTVHPLCPSQRSRQYFLHKGLWNALMKRAFAAWKHLGRSLAQTRAPEKRHAGSWLNGSHRIPEGKSTGANLPGKRWAQLLKQCWNKRNLAGVSWEWNKWAIYWSIIWYVQLKSSRLGDWKLCLSHCNGLLPLAQYQEPSQFPDSSHWSKDRLDAPEEGPCDTAPRTDCKYIPNPIEEL